MARVEYGLQMYSLRDITGDDLKGALKLVADMGYKYIEFAGFFGHKAEDVKAWLDEYGLVCSGTHTGGDALQEGVLADTIAPEAETLLKKTRFHKNYRLALHGWMEYQIAALEISTMSFLSNPAGKGAKKTLELNFGPKGK